jgi:hypothetical protein
MPNNQTSDAAIDIIPGEGDTLDVNVTPNNGMTHRNKTEPEIHVQL